ncbi:hypothetical protein OGAPHI_005208 [Ogataea philodendri]|uniref:Uncharacterized protein n=1 Tax=Ogataea philodendri TaxID=1378263 RepID=A0A9P8P294_9ASCO|nr:uncharacterized protein OGAPHI_005208 [Ogataea philodendri]KAH3663805.1 hypothetical protein OGAPHI_005208 [Ogataea philodendri]
MDSALRVVKEQCEFQHGIGDAGLEIARLDRLQDVRVGQSHGFQNLVQICQQFTSMSEKPRKSDIVQFDFEEPVVQNGSQQLAKKN